MLKMYDCNFCEGVEEMDLDGYIDDGMEGDEVLLNDEDHSDIEIQMEIMHSDEDTDGMEDIDLSSEDEEFMEGRKKMKVKRMKNIESVMNTNEVQLNVNHSSSALMSRDIGNESWDASTYEDESGDVQPSNQQRTGNLQYDKNCDHKNLTFQVGMQFTDVKECKDAIKL